MRSFDSFVVTAQLDAYEHDTTHARRRVYAGGWSHQIPRDLV